MIGIGRVVRLVVRVTPVKTIPPAPFDPAGVKSRRTLSIASGLLVGAVAQRLRFHEGQKLLVPECEVLMASTASRAVIRQGQFFKLASSLETGAADGSFTFARYGEWLARKTDFVHPSTVPEPAIDTPAPPKLARAGVKAPAPRRDTVTDDGTLVLDEEDGDLSQIIDALEKD